MFTTFLKNSRLGLTIDLRLGYEGRNPVNLWCKPPSVSVRVASYLLSKIGNVTDLICIQSFSLTSKLTPYLHYFRVFTFIASFFFFFSVGESAIINRLVCIQKFTISFLTIIITQKSYAWFYRLGFEINWRNIVVSASHAIKGTQVLFRPEWG